MLRWHCDICDKRVYINPKFEQVFDEVDREIDVPVPDPEDSTKFSVQKQTVKQQVPRMAKAKRQNLETGDVETIDVPEINDLEDRAYIVKLKAGSESVQRTFCRGCLDAHVKPVMSPLWDKLEAPAEDT